MILTRWSNSYAVCVPQIDSEHRVLIRLANDLYGSLAVNSPPSRVQPVLHDLAGHADAHFAHEESMMRACRYPLYEWHRRQHLAAISSMKRLARTIRRRRADLALAQLEALAAVLHNHIRLADRMLGAYLRNYQRALSVRVNGTPTVARAAQLDGC